MIVSIRGLRKTGFLRAASVVGVRGGSDGGKIGPSVERIDFAPAVGRTSGVGGGGLRGDDAIELIVAESLRTSRVEVVGDSVHVAGIFDGQGIDEAVGNINGIATSRTGFELERLQAGVICVSKVQASKGGSLPNGKGVKRTFRGVAHFAGQAAGRSGLKVGCVGDAVRSICRSTGAVCGIVGIVYGPTRRINYLREVARQIKVVR